MHEGTHRIQEAELQTKVQRNPQRPNWKQQEAEETGKAKGLGTNEQVK